MYVGVRFSQRRQSPIRVNDSNPFGPVAASPALPAFFIADGRDGQRSAWSLVMITQFVQLSERFGTMPTSAVYDPAKRSLEWLFHDVMSEQMKLRPEDTHEEILAALDHLKNIYCKAYDRAFHYLVLPLP